MKPSKADSWDLNIPSLWEFDVWMDCYPSRRVLFLLSVRLWLFILRFYVILIVSPILSRASNLYYVVLNFVTSQLYGFRRYGCVLTASQLRSRFLSRLKDDVRDLSAAFIFVPLSLNNRPSFIKQGLLLLLNLQASFLGRGLRRALGYNRYALTSLSTLFVEEELRELTDLIEDYVCNFGWTMRRALAHYRLEIQLEMLDIARAISVSELNVLRSQLHLACSLPHLQCTLTSVSIAQDDYQRSITYQLVIRAHDAEYRISVTSAWRSVTRHPLTLNLGQRTVLIYWILKNQARGYFINEVPVSISIITH